MDFNDFKQSASETLWTSAADWFKATIPKPPAQSSAAPQVVAQPQVIIQQPSVDTKAILKYAGIAAAGLVGLFLITRRKGRK